MNSYKINKSIFKKSSTTYYYSSIFFPRDIKTQVFTLYAFVRTSDNFVDDIPQDKKGFYMWKEQTLNALLGKTSGVAIIDNFIDLAREKRFEDEWIVEFLGAMEMDLKKKTYRNFAELEKYIYGSAEVIGLMMAKILGLPKSSYKAARQQGKAMQLINFLRDVKEDLELGRIYLPQDDIVRFGLDSKLMGSHNWNEFMKFQLQRYYRIQKAAEDGYGFIPKRYRIPVATAAGMYNWTAEQINKDPSVVWNRKVKPGKTRVMTGLLQSFFK